MSDVNLFENVHARLWEDNPTFDIIVVLVMTFHKCWVSSTYLSNIYVKQNPSVNYRDALKFFDCAIAELHTIGYIEPIGGLADENEYRVTTLGMNIINSIFMYSRVKLDTATNLLFSLKQLKELVGRRSPTITELYCLLVFKSKLDKQLMYSHELNLNAVDVTLPTGNEINNISGIVDILINSGYLLVSYRNNTISHMLHISAIGICADVLDVFTMQKELTSKGNKL
jgi:hypothetical protein